MTGYKSKALKNLGKAVLATSLLTAPMASPTNYGCGIYLDRVYDKEGNVRASHYSFFGSGSRQKIDGDKVENDSQQYYIDGFGWGYRTYMGGYFFPGTGIWHYPSTLTPVAPPIVTGVPGSFIGPSGTGGIPYRIFKKIDKEKSKDFSLLEKKHYEEIGIFPQEKQRDFTIIGIKYLPFAEQGVIEDLVAKHLASQKPKATI